MSFLSVVGYRCGDRNHDSTCDVNIAWPHAMGL
ncbi:unnamed protein product [Chondrus crispus]|uniref:Uncharacterized protein n=1 Tax=Chondrus crispus TaxID=2769 RepID=R7Q7B0_CHOCR|nr:unnamed protein product [Chondrus crispus]CDF33355.1 unnamed protein product [Chondrus crispus]|eukprot:XP_005713158.1 unnamed protein product [Chondrus crispus]